MVGQEYKNVFNAPHLTFFPGIALMLVVLAFNLLGDGLRDSLDPRLARTRYAVDRTFCLNEGCPGDPIHQDSFVR